MAMRRGQAALVWRWALLMFAVACPRCSSGEWPRTAQRQWGESARWLRNDRDSAYAQRQNNGLGRDRLGPSAAVAGTALGGAAGDAAEGGQKQLQTMLMGGMSTGLRRQPMLPLAGRRRSRPTGTEAIDVPLTALGERLRNGTIVFRGLNNVCSNTDDWRHWLPVYLYRFTGTRVIVWNTLDSFNCRRCPRTGSFRSTPPCQRVLRGIQADMLVVVGAGKIAKKFNETKCRLLGLSPLAAAVSPALDCQLKFRYVGKSISQPWITPNTVKVHFPISTLPALNEHNVFGFQRIIGDISFLKPIGLDAARTLKRCIPLRKHKTLMYIARYRPSKGLVAFLEGIQTEVLGGYTLHVYGDVDVPRVKAKAQAIVRRKGLPVVFHRQVSKAQLLNSLCRTSGIVHYAERDKNPRVAYEGLYAGAPVFITNSSGVPDEFYALPFVQVSKFQDYIALNNDFQEFLRVAAKPQDIAPAIRSFLDGPMHPTTVYQGICRDMGICG